MRRVALIIVCGMLAAGHLRCSMQVADATGGSETTNGITACAIRADGTPASGAFVRLRRSDWVTATPALAKTAIYGADALTDSNGRFEIRGVDPGSYRIEVTDGHAAVLLACSLDVRDTLDLGVDTLRPFATIAGTVDTAGRAGQRAYVQVEGLARLAAVDDEGRFVIADLPAGNFTVRAVTVQDTTIAAASNVTVGPGERTDVTVLSGWRFSKRLYLNTTATGANVSEDVTGFPLLIRFDGSTSLTTGSTNFDFTQARDSGQDVRFTKPDGSALPYEIEQWDAAARTAAIWVRIDTVRGNASTQFLVMHWGASTGSAPGSLSNSAAVFDTADGYSLVYHFEDDPAAGVGDASAMDNLGSASAGLTSASIVPGVIGPAIKFNGVNDTITVPHGRLELGAYDLIFSAWVRSAAAGRGGIITLRQFDNWQRRFRMMINDFGEIWYGLCDTVFIPDTIPRVTGQVGGGPGWIDAVGHTKICDDTWHLVTVTFARAGTAVLSIDGVPDDTLDISYLSASRFDDLELVIGYDDYNLGSHLNAALDEVTMRRSSRFPAWERLMYVNQMAGSRLIEFH
jgi:hypothetical protein